MGKQQARSMVAECMRAQFIIQNRSVDQPEGTDECSLSVRSRKQHDNTHTGGSILRHSFLATSRPQDNIKQASLCAAMKGRGYTCLAVPGSCTCIDMYSARCQMPDEQLQPHVLIFSCIIRVECFMNNSSKQQASSCLQQSVLLKVQHVRQLSCP